MVRMLRTIIAGVVTLVLSFSILRPAGELCALLIRQHWPETWFSGLIVWYADFLAVVFSLAIAVVVVRYTLMHPNPGYR
jgi:hypothetical protein